MTHHDIPTILALVNGFKDAGCGFASNYPGSSTQDIFFGLGGKIIATNEKSAFEQAYGASLAGHRTVVSLKSVGLNACADQFLHSIIAGVNGGLTVVVVDDTQVVASQERQDSRHYIDFFGGLWLEPSTVQMAYDMAYQSFELSERFDVPIVMRITTQLLHAMEDYQSNKPPLGTLRKPLDLRPEKYISYPIFWRRQWDNLKKKNAAIQAYVESQYSERIHDLTKSQEIHALVFGICEQEVMADAIADSLKATINHYPIPRDYVRAITRHSPKFTVYEQGDNYAFQSVQNIIRPPATTSNTPIVLSNTGDCPDLTEQWITWSYLSKLFKALKNIQPSFVVGDVGQYTVESEHVIDACLCLGSSIGVTTGLALSEINYPFCVTGDASYLHGGAIVLGEAVARNARFGVIIIDNGGSGATGGQPLVQDIHTYNSLAVRTIDFDSCTEQQLTDILSDMRTSQTLSILHINIHKGIAS